MKHIQQAALLAATALALAMPTTRAGAFAGDNVAAADPGFTPNSGQINRGFDPKVPTASQPRPIPTPAEARAAKMTPDKSQPSVGAQQTAGIPSSAAMSKDTKDGQATAGGPQAVNGSSDAMQNGAHDAGGRQPQLATSGAASQDSAASQTSDGQGIKSEGPIGATGQTMPAKFSKRNDTLDRVPTMAQPSTLSDQDRQNIYRAAMADKTPADDDAGNLAPASQLDPHQALNEMHPLPASVSGIKGVQALAYVKTKDKVFLVEPATRIVVEEIDS